MDRSHLSQGLAVLGSTYGWKNEGAEDRVRAWGLLLGDLPGLPFVASCLELARECKFAPSPAEVIARMTGSLTKEREEERERAYRSLRKTDPGAVLADVKGFRPVQVCEESMRDARRMLGIAEPKAPRASVDAGGELPGLGNVEDKEARRAASRESFERVVKPWAKERFGVELNGPEDFLRAVSGGRVSRARDEHQR